MKIHSKILATALLSSLLATPALAANDENAFAEQHSGPGPYLALSVGKGAIYPGCPTGFTTCKAYNKNVYFATYGYQYTPRWGLELNYGKGGYISSDQASISAMMLSVSGVGTLHLGDSLGAFAKIGLTYGDFRVASGTVPSGYILSPAGYSPSGGVGILLNFSHHLSLRVEGDFLGSYTVLTNAKKMNIVATTVGLQWRY